MTAPEQETAGQIVGEIAYDINNLLTVVAGSALRLCSRPELTAVTEELAQIICATERAAELTRQLLAVDGEPAELTLVDLAEAIRRLEPTIRLLLSGDIVLDSRHYQPAPSVLIEPARFEQILMNLIMNASDAMAQRRHPDCEHSASERFRTASRTARYRRGLVCPDVGQ